MDAGQVRSASRRLVVGLVVVVLLVGLPVDFPRDRSASDAWGFLVGHVGFLLHAVLGTLVVVEAVRLLVRASAARAYVGLAAVGLAFTALAALAGATYVSAGQEDGALTAMTLGWLGALVTYVVAWVRSRRAVLAGRRAA